MSIGFGSEFAGSALRHGVRNATSGCRASGSQDVTALSYLGAPPIETGHLAKLTINLLLAFACGSVFFESHCPAQDSVLYGTVGMDPYAAPTTYSDPSVIPVSNSVSTSSTSQWYLDLLPEGLIYRPYLAGPKESRTGIQFYNTDDDWQFDSSIGGQWGLFRIGTLEGCFPQGLQLDVEASAQFRHSQFASQNVLTNDIRFGLPLSYGRNNHQTKLSLYFLRSNPGEGLWDAIGSIGSDEFFQRKAFVLGHSIYLTDRFRIYGEADYALSSKVSENWAFQFGAECAPVCPTGILGAPFLAANVLLREEVDFGGTFTLQGGWAWRKRRGRLFRIGLQYANGASNHFSMHDLHEQQLGFGIWYDI